MFRLLTLAILLTAVNGIDGHHDGFARILAPLAPDSLPYAQPQPEIVPVYPIGRGWWDDWSSSSESYERRDRRHRNHGKKVQQNRCKDLRETCDNADFPCSLPTISYFYHEDIKMAYINCKNYLYLEKGMALLTGQNTWLSEGIPAAKVAMCGRDGKWKAANQIGVVEVFDIVRCAEVE
ncbi:unnamed protein product [Strongylus vulgaris]|uniref:C-type lectin domain-containing protein n=1 Tax=Strongylus vulgaris TaxID=40348 RepID=A0A3P7J6L3_STRVU|nr:unnamed protein product [Strongylus vulgaris]